MCTSYIQCTMYIVHSTVYSVQYVHIVQICSIRVRLRATWSPALKALLCKNGLARGVLFTLVSTDELEMGEKGGERGEKIRRDGGEIFVEHT